MFKELVTMVWKPQIEWVKRHWIAYIVISVVGGVLFGTYPYWVGNVKDWFKEKFSRKEES
ncbi:MAG: hypothetical protein LUE29_09515 [Lachnospiraceae bacterium]|nr:hypothetical protein [Lachnospiraceae bacterium]